MPGLDGPIEYKRSHNSDRNSNSVAMFQEFFSTRRPYFFHLCLERNVVNNFSFCVETTNPAGSSRLSHEFDFSLWTLSNYYVQFIKSESPS